MPEGRGGILRVTQEGQIVNGKGILGDGSSLWTWTMHTAYGMALGWTSIPSQVIYGTLKMDRALVMKINLVMPGFNSGWAQIAGIWPITNYELLNSTPEQKGIFDTPESLKN